MIELIGVGVILAATIIALVANHERMKELAKHTARTDSPSTCNKRHWRERPRKCAHKRHTRPRRERRPLPIRS